MKQRVDAKGDLWRALLTPGLHLDYTTVFHRMTRDELDEALYVADHFLRRGE